MQAIGQLSIIAYNLPMSRGVPLSSNTYYHVYLSGDHERILFPDDASYKLFLRLYAELIEEVAETFAYCLLPNHFHFFVRIRPMREQADIWFDEDRDTGVGFRPKFPRHQFAQLFADYAAQTGTQSALLTRPIIRTPVSNRRQSTHLIRYIHQNPTLHDHTPNFRDWRYSSYRAILANSPTRIATERVLRWFHSADWFEELHWEPVDLLQLGYLIIED